MTEDNKRENIDREVSLAETTLTEATLLFDHELWAGAISRAYYYVCHMARALLLSEGLETKTHSGLAHMINLHFVRTGRIDSRVARYLGELGADRSSADYDAACVFLEDIAAERLDHARIFGNAAREYLIQGGYLPAPS